MAGLEAGLSRQLLGAARGRRRRRYLDHALGLPDVRRHGRGGARYRGGRLRRHRVLRRQCRSTARRRLRRHPQHPRRHRLSLVSVYSGGNFIFADILDEELARVTKAADAAQALGAEHLVVGGGARRFDGTRAQRLRRAWLRRSTRLSAIATARGLKAHYHPHLSTIVENPDEVRTDLRQDRIGFCPDTAHLAAAGGDVAAMVREHASRISYVHLKGWQREPFAFMPVGRGDCDNGAVIRALKDIGYAGWICNELDAWPDPAARRAGKPRLRQARSWRRPDLRPA